MTPFDIGIAIPAYRDPVRLRKCLESIDSLNRELLSRTTVVDDSGGGEVASALRSEFPMVHWIVHDVNKGFGESATRAVMDSNTKLVMLLNDDVLLTRDPRPKVCEVFQDDSVFALSLATLDESGRPREGRKELSWRFGIAKVLHLQTEQSASTDLFVDTAYAVGGHAIFRRDAFVALDGFDRMFHPFYWEDVDLSERARIAGFTVRCLLSPCIVHSDRGAIKTSQASSAIREAVWRNRFLFSLRHATGVQRLLQPLGFAWYRLLNALRPDASRALALRDALSIFRSSPTQYTKGGAWKRKP